MTLRDFRVLTFDCYGTLIDWETGLLRALAPLRSRAPVTLSDDAVLEAFALREASQQAAAPDMPYSAVLSAVHRQLTTDWDVAADAAADARFGASVGDWPAFPDTAEALRYLKQHYRLVILSNVDHASFARSLPRLGVAFDAVHTAQDIGSYKPDPRNFTYLMDRLAADGFTKPDVLHVAQSLFHDHVPANAIGLASAWIDRRHARGGSGATAPAGGDVRYDFRFPSMADLVAAHRSLG
ncbi:haloacid dehalogenase type II [Rhodopila sp.]|jgi:2-haloalkanoic acid dehalogenase type II|uniref:haloacid dehalogenase type II n=1 Tax=Rhodopila sp. TaxID=2480087 RepID=UPI002CAF2722|nr:haloacid dehalogenase type II [Rhodopila sp.]HVZ10604.1 haloacid dehalogenase type II [Rhodopila sp.]